MDDVKIVIKPNKLNFMRSKNTFGISFFTRKHRGTETKVPIYARITVDGKRTELSIKMDVDPNNWHKARGSAKGKGDDIKEMNTSLEQIRSRLVECYQELIVKKLSVTADNVKNRYLGIEKTDHSLLSVFKYHNQAMKGVLAKRTLDNYGCTERLLEWYIKDVCKKSDLSLYELNYSFLVGFDKYLRERKMVGMLKPCTNNGAMKNISRLKKVVNLSIKNEWLDIDPFRKYKLSYIKSVRKHLSEDELNAIEAKEYEDKSLQEAKDTFVFSCYTGLAHIESINLTPQCIIKGIDGEYWLSLRRKKTHEPVKVPLLPKALAIIEKYKNHPAVLANGKLIPTLPNHAINKVLKKIACDCGVLQNLTFHMARHTFATIVTLTNGVPIETVSKILGHTSIKTTQIYAKVLERKVSDDLHLLRIKLDEKEKAKKALLFAS